MFVSVPDTQTHPNNKTSFTEKQKKMCRHLFSCNGNKYHLRHICGRFQPPPATTPSGGRKAATEPPRHQICHTIATAVMVNCGGYSRHASWLEKLLPKNWQENQEQRTRPRPCQSRFWAKLGREAPAGMSKVAVGAGFKFQNLP